MNLVAAVAEAALQKPILHKNNRGTGFSTGVMQQCIDKELGTGHSKTVQDVVRGAKTLVERVQQRSLATAHAEGQPLTARFDLIKTIQVHYWCNITQKVVIATTHIANPPSSLLPLSAQQQQQVINIGVTHKHSTHEFGGVIAIVPFAFVPRPTMVGGHDALA